MNSDHSPNSTRVLYQRVVPSHSGSAVVHIDDGYIAALRAAGCEVHVWCDDGSESFVDVLSRAEPTVFIAMLQRSDRQPSSWTAPDAIDSLVKMKKDVLFIAARSGPSDMPDLAPEFMAEMGIDLGAFPQAGVRSYYTQSRRPLPDERRAIEAGVIDLILTPLAQDLIPRLFRSFLDLGLRVQQELFAVDIHRYTTDAYSSVQHEDQVDVSYVGGCWPFKWHAMRPYCEALRGRFGGRFVIHGRGWPSELAVSPLAGDSAYIDLVGRSKVCLSLHEPSQLIRTPFAINERPFKLAALGACVVSDPNPMLMNIFDPGTEMLFADSPEHMAELVNELVTDHDRRRSIGCAARRRVLAEHTYDHRVAKLLSLAGNPGFPANSNSHPGTPEIQEYINVP